MPKILYLVHDLSDAAVLRRIQMLQDGGAHVVVGGFRRSESLPQEIAGAKIIDFGMTYNSNFKQRIKMVLKTIRNISKYKTHFADCDIIIARNLEMLAIAVRGKSITKHKPVLIYESLDIHRLLIRDDIIGKLLRTLEGWLGKRCDGLITSSPAFIEHYFKKMSKLNLPIQLVENKVYIPLKQESYFPTDSIIRPEEAWRIGWFGALRCKKTLSILTALAQKFDGKIEIVIRGKPSYDQMPDFDKIVSETPHVAYHGKYKYPDDLQEIYQDIHFTWAIDMFEEGLNSNWLLPNRVYEGGLFTAVPIAQKNVETGNYIDRLGIGVALEKPLQKSLDEFFGQITYEQYKKLYAQSSAIEKTQWMCSNDECKNLVLWIQNLAITPK